jgi:hypothetical protein
MSDPRVDDLLRDLRAELSIEPSPQLVARVRARIDNRSNSTPLIPAWTVGVALLMTTIALGIAPDRQGEKSIAPAGTSRGQVAQPVRLIVHRVRRPDGRQRFNRPLPRPSHWQKQKSLSRRIRRSRSGGFS